MIIWVLMALDLIAFISASLAHFGVAVSATFLVACGGYLITKLVIFRDVMSGIDAVFGLYMIIMAIFHVSTFLYYLMAIWFAYKLIFTIVNTG